MEVGLKYNADYGRHGFLSFTATIAFFLVIINAVTCAYGYPMRWVKALVSSNGL